MDMIDQNHPLFNIWEAVKSGKRLTKEDGIRLINSNDIIALGYMANFCKEQRHGTQIYYSVHHPLDPSITYKMESDFLTKPKEEQLEGLLEVRNLQDQSNRFRTFAVSLEGNSDHVTGFAQMRFVALSRLLLDNMESIGISWGGSDGKIEQSALFFGADCLVATDSPTGKPEEEILRLIERAGKTPVKIHAEIEAVNMEQSLQ